MTSIGALMSAVICSNTAIQNNLRIQREEEKRKSQKVEPTFQSSFNKDKQKN